MEGLVIDVGRQLYILDVDGGHGLQPYGLPDARGGGIIDIVGVEHLLAVQTDALVGGVEYFYEELVVALLQCSGDVECKGRVAAGVGAHLVTVDKYGSLPVHGAKMQEQLFTGL
ncbi:hypothetical protein GCM10011511_55010 [Puia dinghuensis]|uniref:Uncharacterized protein n=1 Tax=Puia dinghuensis TaxID=1792502 RepID=A0A8J2XU99_9BACT|nr:hypothetical protein GCM10011511_55010 [Puia dinghuensis]